MNLKVIKDRHNRAGFTLIELLIVMAILGVLAVVVLVAINPVQQLARTRDAGRKSAVSQVGRALEAFYTSHGGKYFYYNPSPPTTNCDTESPANLPFTNNDQWLTCLRNAGEISEIPASIDYQVTGVIPCQLPAMNNYSRQNGLCYAINGATGDQAVVYSRLESASEASKCKRSGFPIPFFIWSTADGRGGLVCLATDSSAPGSGNQPVWDE
jgi:prepilin-type N-terminal cleavage/methylation domain-containing protein